MTLLQQNSVILAKASILERTRLDLHHPILHLMAGMKLFISDSFQLK
ncbi:hypothetical protein [Vibrio breoganii]|nr:hypothetical protein [Vibrio breoganii]